MTKVTQSETNCLACLGIQLYTYRRQLHIAYRASDEANKICEIQNILPCSDKIVANWVPNQPQQQLNSVNLNFDFKLATQQPLPLFCYEQKGTQ